MKASRSSFNLAWLSKGLFTVFLFFVYAPLFVLVVFSFNDSAILTFPLKGFTLRWYEQFFGSGTILQAVVNSLTLGGSVALIATAMAILASFAIVRYNFRGKAVFSYLIIMPMVIPYIIMGVSLLIFFSYLGFELSLFTVLLSHTLVALPFATLVLVARLIGFDKSLEEAAMDLGADELTTFRKVTLPLMFPGVLAATMISFLISFEDVVLAFFTIGYQPTIPIYILGQLRHPTNLPILTAITVFMLFISTGIVILSYLVRKFE